MSLGVINSMLLENPICVFSFSHSANLHGNCLSDHCVGQGGKVCLTQRMKGHLLLSKKSASDEDLKYKIAKSGLKFSDFENDWELFEYALKSQNRIIFNDIIEFYERTRHYRLRLGAHVEIGKGLVRGIFNLLRGAFGISFGTVWGTSFWHQINEYERIFHRLVHECESQSVGGIYRLYDLTKGGLYEDEHFPRLYCLCLLFAFGHGAPISPYTDPPESISELVARFEFFENFSESHERYLKRYLRNESPSYQNKQLSNLVSQEYGEIAYKLWVGHMIAAVNTNSGRLLDCSLLLRSVEEHLFLECNPPKDLLIQSKNQLIAPLRNVRFPQFRFQHDHQFNSETARMLHRRNKVAGFNSPFNAAYHPFKHNEVASLFFRGESRKPEIADYRTWTDIDFVNSATKSMENYMNAMKGAIEQSFKTSIQPNQFGEGTVFSYFCERMQKGRKRIVKVIVSANNNGINYSLTCC